jgi:hypothetical protein
MHAVAETNEMHIKNRHLPTNIFQTDNQNQSTNQIVKKFKYLSDVSHHVHNCVHLRLSNN